MVRHIDSAQTKAEASFDGGLYCAESVVRALVGTSEDADADAPGR